MRFGIMEMQLAHLIPDEITPDDAVEKVLGFDRSRLINKLVDQGFSTVELGGDLALFFPTAYGAENIKRLQRLKQEREVSYTLHLPLWSVELSTPLSAVREGSVMAITDIIRAVLPLEPEVYVLHATGALAAEFYRMDLPPAAKSLALKQFQDNAMMSIQTLLKETEINPRKLAVETIEFPLELTLEIADVLDISVCLDTGHILAGFSGAIEFEDALDSCLARLAEVHLHDSPDFMTTGELEYGNDHQALGKGDLDVDLLFKKLNDHDFSGPIIFELSIQEAKESLRTLQNT